MTSPGPERELLLDGLRGAMRLSADAMVLTDPNQADNPIVAVNRAFRDLTLYDEASCVGRNCRFLQGSATDRSVVRLMSSALRRGDGCVQFLVNYRQDGTQFFNLLFISPVLGHDGHLHFFFASQYDLCREPPLTLADFPLGAAHMSPAQQTEFRLLLLDIAAESRLADTADDLRERVRALEAALAAAREIAQSALHLKPGTPA